VAHWRKPLRQQKADVFLVFGDQKGEWRHTSG
jgi:hypothetical protein